MSVDRKLAQENSRFSSLFAAGDVSRRGTKRNETKRNSRNVHTGEERGETDVFAGYAIDVFLILPDPGSTWEVQQGVEWRIQRCNFERWLVHALIHSLRHWMIHDLVGSERGTYLKLCLAWSVFVWGTVVSAASKKCLCSPPFGLNPENFANI